VLINLETNLSNNWSGANIISFAYLTNTFGFF